MISRFRNICLLTMLFTMLSITVCWANSEIREFADPVTENMLIAINEDNYPLFSEYFDEKMKCTLDEKEYQRQASAIKKAFGEYVSKEFVTVETDGQYIVVVYRAKFTQRDNVTVRNVLSKNDEGFLVSGFWLRP